MVSEFPQADIKESSRRDLSSRFFIEHFIRKFFYDRAPEGKIDSSIMDIGFPPGLDTDEGKKQYLLFGVKKIFGKLFKRKSAEFDRLLRYLEMQHYNNEEEMVKTVVNSVYEFANDKSNNFTREEIEEIYKENRQGKIPLNEIMDCNTTPDDPTLLRVHLLGTSGLSAQKIRGGFRELAKILEGGSETGAMRNVKNIALTSYIILERPDIFKKLGFPLLELTDKDKKLGHQRSKISREDFLEIIKKWDLRKNS